MFKIRHLFPQCTTCLRQSRISRFNIKTFSSTTIKNNDIEFDDKPIKYSESPASKYKAKTTRTGIHWERLWYEPYVILGSTAVFLLYFCVFREENDVDKELSASLYSRVHGLEEQQLRLSLRYNEDNGIDTLDIRKRLNEIEREKQK